MCYIGIRFRLRNEVHFIFKQSFRLVYLYFKTNARLVHYAQQKNNLNTLSQSQCNWLAVTTRASMATVRA